MTTQDFIALFQEAFGKKVQLPLLFGYSDEPIANTEKNTRDGYRLCKQPWYETSD